MSAALFIMSLGLGSLVGPLVGGSVYDAFGGNVDPKIDPEGEKRVFLINIEGLPICAHRSRNYATHCRSSVFLLRRGLQRLVRCFQKMCFPSKR